MAWIKTEGKLSLVGVIDLLFILFCLLFNAASTIGSWWYLYYIEFTTKQLFISLLVTIATTLCFWVVFKHIFIIEINKNSLNFPKNKNDSEDTFNILS